MEQNLPEEEREQQDVREDQPIAAAGDLDQILDTLRQDLEAMGDEEALIITDDIRKRLDLPKDMGYIIYRPLSGIELQQFEEVRMKTKVHSTFRAGQPTNVAPPVEWELEEHWVDALKYLFSVAVVDFELRHGDMVMLKGNYRRQSDWLKIFERMHIRLQMFIAGHILKDSGWTPLMLRQPFSTRAR